MKTEDTFPPHSEESERGLIGCLLYGDREMTCDCLAGSRDDYFYDPRHELVYRAVSELVNASQPVDLVAARQKLKDAGHLETVGGAAYLNECVNEISSPHNWTYFDGVLREKHTLRRLQQAVSGIAGRLGRGGDVNELLDSAEQEILTVRGTEVKGENTMKGLVQDALADMEADKDGTVLRGHSFGLHKLDHWTKGMKPQNLVVVAARPSVGKSALAMQFALRLAIDERKPVAVFSLEMSGKEIVERAIRTRSRVPAPNGRDMTDGDFSNLTRAAAEISSAPMFILDDGGATLAQIQARARRLHQRHKLALVVVDYLQLVRCSGRKENRENEVAAVSRGMKQLAMELGIPLLLLAQLNRDCEREDRRPRSADLRESGAIEQDADILMLLHTEKEGPELREVTLLVTKNKSQRRGAIQLMFNGPLTVFHEQAHEEEPPPNGKQKAHR